MTGGRMLVPTVERLLSYVEVTAVVGCWIWLGALHPDGYAFVTTVPRRSRLVHRFLFEVAYGPIPAGLVCDHICHRPETCVGGLRCPHRRCVNPSHLELTTRQANSARSTSAFRTHCLNGHEFTVENTTYHTNGRYRRCLTCIRARGRARRLAVAA